VPSMGKVARFTALIIGIALVLKGGKVYKKP
jgi:hypothetical protein